MVAQYSWDECDETRQVTSGLIVLDINDNLPHIKQTNKIGKER